MTGEHGESTVDGVGLRLRVEWVVVAAVALAVAVGGGSLVGDAVSPAAGRRWSLVTGAVLAYEVAFLALNLGANRVGEARQSVFDSLGLANAVTLLRGVGYAAAAGFVVVPLAPAVAWLPGLLYGVGAALDFVDGFLARRVSRTTVLGARLDLAFDTLGFLLVPLVAVVWGRLPVWYLSISVARYVYRGGLAWRRYRGRSVGELPPSRVRRPLAGLQMAFIAVAVVPVLPTTVTFPLAAVVVTPSLLVFARDYLAVTGRLSS